MTRAPCTCAPGAGFQLARCPACAAWDVGAVLLVEGATMAKSAWLDAWATAILASDAPPDFGSYYAALEEAP